MPADELREGADGPLNAALQNIGDDAAFLPLALSALGGAGAAREYVRHTRQGSEVKCALSISRGNDQIEWTHGIFAMMLKPFRAKHGKLEIPHVRRVQLGQKTTTFKLKQEKKRSVGGKYDGRSFSIVWVRAIELLMDKFQRGGNPFERYIQAQWDKADSDRSGTLTAVEVQQVLNIMNINANKQWFLRKFDEFDLDKNQHMDKDEFTQFVRELFGNRPEVRRLMRQIKAIGKGKGWAGTWLSSKTADQMSDTRLTPHEYALFWNTFQKSEVEAYMDAETAKTIFQKIVGDDTADSIDGMEFAMLLDASENSVFDPLRAQPGCGVDDVATYMSQPLNHYWINSSHNTYLTGDQIHGLSEVQQYGFVLQRGARCVELDCWDGDDKENPLITHGHCFCTKIKFRDVIEEIKDQSFGPPAENPYPVIMSIEMHCSEAYQKKMAEIVTEIMGDSLYRYDASKPFPSPEDLKYKFLLKGDCLSVEPSTTEALGESDDSEDDAEPTEANEDDVNKSAQRGEREEHKRANSRSKKTSIPDVKKDLKKDKPTKEKKQKIIEEWSCLIGLPANKEKKKPLRQIVSGLKGPSCKMQSYAEGKALRMSKENREDFIDFNRYLLSRIYPYGGRTNSTNMNPVPYWSAGCHAVALNFQTGDLGMSLNHGKFRENDRLGYVLKHPSQRASGVASSSCRLKVCVFSCQRLPTKQKQNDILDVYVRIELHGTGTDSTVANTRTINDNGFNPTFGADGEGETFDFDMQDRESAMLRVVVKDSEKTKQDTFIGQNAIPVTCIRQGYRHLSLWDQDDNLVLQAGVLCRFEFEPLPPSN